MTRSPPSVGFSADVVLVDDFLLLLLLPQAADTKASANSAAASPFIALTSRTVSRPPCPVDVKLPGGRWLVPQPRLLQPDGQDDRSEGEHDSGGNGNSVEIALGNR